LATSGRGLAAWAGALGHLGVLAAAAVAAVTLGIHAVLSSAPAIFVFFFFFFTPSPLARGGLGRSLWWSPSLFDAGLLCSFDQQNVVLVLVAVTADGRRCLLRRRRWRR
jgi:hypothetical protein